MSRGSRVDISHHIGSNHSHFTRESNIQEGKLPSFPSSMTIYQRIRSCQRVILWASPENNWLKIKDQIEQVLYLDVYKLFLKFLICFYPTNCHRFRPNKFIHVCNIFKNLSPNCSHQQTPGHKQNYRPNIDLLLWVVFIFIIR